MFKLALLMQMLPFQSSNFIITYVTGAVVKVIGSSLRMGFTAVFYSLLEASKQEIFSMFHVF